MARIRSIHPGIWTDEAFVSASPYARLLFIGIWNECDDQGAFEWKPVQLKMRLMPADNVDIAALLEELETSDRIRRYSLDGRHYGAVRNFQIFQRPKKPNSIHPMTDEIRNFVASKAVGSEPDDDEVGGGSEPTPFSNASSSPPPPLKVVSSSQAVPHQFGTGSRISPQMEDGGDKGRRKEEDRSLRSLPRQAGAAEAFNDFWAAYPRKVGKNAARKAWTAALKGGADPQAIGLALAAQRWPDDPQFIPHPSTWLNGGRWQDDPTAAAPPRTAPPSRHAAQMAKLARILGAASEAPEPDLLAVYHVGAVQ